MSLESFEHTAKKRAINLFESIPVDSEFWSGFGSHILADLGKDANPYDPDNFPQELDDHLAWANGWECAEIIMSEKDSEKMRKQSWPS